MKPPGLGDLDAVIAIARRGSFRAAALDLGLSTTALSNAIGKLEASLGVRLFNRTTRSVSPTDAGRAFVEQVGPGRCLLTTEQHGAIEQVRCDAIARGDSLILLAAGGGRYRPGTPLLKLGRDDRGIVTYWLGYAHAPVAQSGRCFVRR